MLNVSLIKLNREDVKFIKDHFSTFFKDNSIENIERIIDSWKQSLGFGVVCDNQKVGIIALSEKADQSLSWGVAILEDYQGKGIATKAFELVVNEAKQKGYSKIISSCAENNIASKNLHKKVGFSLIKEEINQAGNKMCRWEISI